MSTIAPPARAPRARPTGGSGGSSGSGGSGEPAVVPDLGPDDARALAVVVKALADPTRLRIVDALRKAAPEAICQCELVPLFAMSQPALARHLKVLVAAGVIASERRGTWVHYVVPADSRVTELATWLADVRA